MIKPDEAVRASILHSVEGPELAAETTIAEGWRHFTAALCRSPQFSSLVALASETGGARSIFERATELCVGARDPRYWHPEDVAIAAYLICLDSLDETLAMELAARASMASGLYWGRKAAIWILQNQRRSSSPTIVTTSYGPALSSAYSVALPQSASFSSDVFFASPALSTEGVENSRRQERVRSKGTVVMSEERLPDTRTNATEDLLIGNLAA